MPLTAAASFVPRDKRALLRRVYANRAIAAFTPPPPLAQQLREYGSPDASAEMVLALAPVDTRPAKRPPLKLKRCRVYPEADQKCPTFIRQQDFIVAPLQNADGNPMLEHSNGKVSGQMIVARPCPSHLVVLRTGPQAQMSSLGSDGDKRFDSVGNVSTGEREILEASLLPAADQTHDSIRDKCVLAVDAETLASRASSLDVRAMPDISAMSILARAGSPIIAATLEISGHLS